MMWWQWLIVTAAVPLGAAAIVAGVGALLPRTHVAQAEAIIPASPAVVAAMIRDVEAQPRWRRGVTAIEVVGRGEGRMRYVERQRGDAILFDFAEDEPGARFTSTIADPALPFGGAWTIALTPQAKGTLVSIEENGEVRNPVYRFFSTLVFGHDATMKAYLEDLGRAFVSQGD